MGEKSEDMKFIENRERTCEETFLGSAIIAPAATGQAFLSFIASLYRGQLDLPLQLSEDASSQEGARQCIWPVNPCLSTHKAAVLFSTSFSRSSQLI